MFEDTTWLEPFHRQKTELMADSYSLMTSFLRTSEIPYIERNAGLFIWIDLSKIFLSKSKSKNLDDLLVTGANAEYYKQQEINLVEKCAENKVMISAGHVYMAESYGWFRLTFTVERDALEEGLRRFGRSLKAFREDSEQ
ncbi:hypothetical protein QQS21_000361 [Conoideocrella luteorostrata]|uniref:Aminotransferase class I/classII large domain-containing protein n=1 Tax=Conoideocrella luteorostrata TaxID=1105319 RepID=A0AAJ0CZ42_9HYPO|nr:hypothetical protein QQS21_000361 [Conoideocrella luteorostrata]